MPTAQKDTTLAEQVAADAGEFRRIPLGQLRVAPWNARKTCDPVAMKELIASIREHDIQVPLLTRIMPETSSHSVADHEAILDGELYEIIAGQRRFHAALKLGDRDVPCIVKDLTDEEAREIGLLDNLQRENVPALEEADAYRELQQMLGTAAAIAQRVGKDVGYVTKRLQLVSLGAMPRRALAERLITIDHALLLAKLGAEEQEQALRWTLNKHVTVRMKTEEVLAAAREKRGDTGEDEDGGFGRVGAYWEPQSVLELKHWIEGELELQLSRAPWDLADANLVSAAGPCTGCPKNTAANTALFGDLVVEEATCTDSICFNAKRTAIVQLQLAAVKSVDAKAVKLSWNESTAKPRFLKDSTDVNPDQTFKAGQWVEAKKGSCPNVVTGVGVDYHKNRGYGDNDKKKRPGVKVLVCVTPKCKTHPKAWEKAARKGGSGGSHFDQKAHEEQREKQRQAALAESKLRVAAAGEAIAKIEKLPEAALRAMLLEKLNQRGTNEQQALVPGLKKYLESAPLLSPQFAKAAAVLSIDSIRVYDHQEPKTWRTDFLKSLQRLGYDASSHWQKPKPEKKAVPAKAAAKPTSTKKPARRILSDATRKRIADLQKRALAKRKGASK